MGGTRVTLRLRPRATAIIESYQSGKSLHELARQYSCSTMPIRQLLKDHGIQSHPGVRPRILEPIREQVVRRYQAGETTLQLASCYSVNKKTIRSFLNQAGVMRRRTLGKRSFFIENNADRGALARLLLEKGSITVDDHRVTIRIPSTDSSILGWLAQFGGKVYWLKNREPNLVVPRGAWSLRKPVDAFYCLIETYPFLAGRKREMATEALEMLRGDPGLREPDVSAQVPHLD